MLQPVGPLPPSVYWRRRLLAGVAVVVVLGLMIWALAATLSSGSDETTAAAPTTPPATAPPSPVASLGALAVPPGGAVPGNGTVLGPTAPQPSLAPSAAPAPSSSRPTGRAAAPAAPAPTCPDSAITVTARTDRPTYTDGTHPVFSLVVTNTGPTACRRDLDAARQAMAVVRTPGDGLWGSNDCSPGHTDDERTLQPRQEVVFTVRWAGKTSRPGCRSADRETVGPGTYQLITRLDGITSLPVPFTLMS